MKQRSGGGLISLQFALLVFLTMILVSVAMYYFVKSPALNEKTEQTAVEPWDETLEVIMSRRTVRDFLPDSIPQKHLLKILDAARMAPSAGNLQPWKFVLVKERGRLDSLQTILMTEWVDKVKRRKGVDSSMRDSLAAAGIIALENIFQAPVFIFVLVDTAVSPQYGVYDGCLAAENIMIAARAMGYGTGFFTTYFPEETVKHFLKAPGNYKFICSTPVGIPRVFPDAPPKKKLEEVVVEEGF